MTPIKLYTAFHANLDFSALPDADRALVISRCYWPLLALPERHGIPIGFELSARTLTILAREDPEWLKRFASLVERGLAEVIGSGWAQIVAPLAPVEVNRENLRFGREGYRELLGFEPTTYFVGEQTYAEGLMPLFAEAGAARVIMEWNNPAARRKELRALRGQPVRWDGGSESSPVILWNDSVIFQKAQRVSHGVIPTSEFDGLLNRIVSKGTSESICIYGGDVEIFDYRPSRTVPLASDGEREIDRLVGLLERLSRDPRFEFSLPRNVVEEDALLPRVHLASASDPLPCKKQPRYNPTRWAVSGRDGFGMNTRCYSLLQSNRAVRALSGGLPGTSTRSNENRALVELWRSDFRTRATEEKIEAFETGMGTARARSRLALESVVPELNGGADVLLVNPWSTDWAGMPVEIPLRMSVGRCVELSVKCLGGGELDQGQWQVDVIGRHRDGSIRDARLVLEPTIEATGMLRLRLESVAACLREAPLRDRACEVGTEQVNVRLLEHRGAALDSLSFPGVWESPLLGTIGHGTFDEIEFTPDFYSGHVVSVSENATKTTDLEAVSIRAISGESGSVRLTLEAEVKSSFGPWRKQIRLYRNRPRMEWVHQLRFHEARLSSLRLGMFTLLPWEWNASALRYGAVNGGENPDWYALSSETRVSQSAAVSPGVSATSCLGATEGWVAIEDDEKGVLIEGDRANAALAPMLDFSAVDDAFFCRLSHSAAETDETRATFIRGERRFGFAVEGYSKSQRGVFDQARMRHQGLVYRTENGVGITGSL